MLEERPISLRQSPSRRRLLRPGVDTDDRGWTSLHVYARKGDIKLAQLANPKQLADHYASKHPKEKPPAESS